MRQKEILSVSPEDTERDNALELERSKQKRTESSA